MRVPYPLGPSTRGRALRGGMAHGPAGRYYAVAGDYVPQQAWTSPEYLEQLGPWTTSFELRDAQTETLSLRLANLEGAVW